MEGFGEKKNKSRKKRGEKIRDGNFLQRAKAKGYI